MLTHKIKVVRVRGLEALYVDGVFRAEAETLHTDEILAALGFDPVSVVYADADWFEGYGYFPVSIREVQQLKG